MKLKSIAQKNLSKNKRKVIFKNLIPIKDILKTLPSSGINNYNKVLQRQSSRKTAVKELGKME